jgi:hypothetical protein
MHKLESIVCSTIQKYVAPVVFYQMVVLSASVACVLSRLMFSVTLSLIFHVRAVH